MRLKHYVLTSSNPMHWIALSDELAEATRLCSPTYGVEFLEQHQDVIRGHDGLVPVFFDQQIEKWIHHLGVPICFPAADVRAAIEDKCEAVRLAQDAGLDLAPTCLAKLTGYAQLKALAASAGLGEELVVQIPSGNSGKGTFAIQTESDYRQVADQLETAKECRIMKALPSPQSFCLESVLTDAGMVIGLPALDLVGLPELTPNPDGWCGNVIGRGMIDPDLVRQMRESSFRIARALQRRHPDFFGYSGDDYLLASGSKQLIYQEKNARCTGMMPLSNIAARELGIPSLLVHHLLQYQGDCRSINVAALNERWSSIDEVGITSCLIVKHLEAQPSLIRSWPGPGLYGLTNGGLHCWSDSLEIQPLLETFDRGLWIPELSGRVVQSQDILGRLLVRGQVTEGNALNATGQRWIQAIRKAILDDA